MAPAIANQTEVELNRGLDGKEFDYDNWVRNMPKNIRVFDARKHSLGPVEGELLNQAEIGALEVCRPVYRSTRASESLKIPIATGRGFLVKTPQVVEITVVARVLSRR